MSKAKEAPAKAAKKESFELAKIKVSQLPELQGWKDKQLAILRENPFVKIEDAASYEVAKKSRTTLVSARTAIEKQDKIIASKLKELRVQAGEFAAELIEITKPAETEQQTEVKRWEEIKAAEAEEKRLEEEKRKEAIQDEIRKIFLLFEEALETSDLKEFAELADKFESLEEMDRERFEEFEFLFIDKLDALRLQLRKRLEFLKDQDAKEKERARLELQNARLQKLAPINHFGSPEALDRLSEISEEDFNKILEVKRKLAQDAIDAEAKRNADAEAKAEKDRLEKKKLEDELAELREMKAAAAKEKLETRVNTLKNYGFVNAPSFNGGAYWQPQTNTNINDAALVEWSTDTWSEFIEDQIVKIKKADEALAKEEADRMKKEAAEEAQRQKEADAQAKAEAKRVKALQPIKDQLKTWANSLDFTEEVPEVKDPNARRMVEDFQQTLTNLKADFINDINDLK